MGHCLALGALPCPLLSSRLKQVLDGLVGVASYIKDCEPQYTESRRDAVRAISRCAKLSPFSVCLHLSSLLCCRVCRTVGVGKDGLTQEYIDTVFCTLAAAMNDYTTDARGDIGAV